MNCLTHSQIETLLNLPDGQCPEELSDHVARCSSCRQRLDATASSPELWDSACQVLHQASAELTADESGKNPTRVDFHSSMICRITGDRKSEPPNEPATATEAVFHDPRTLDPPAHPENLGRIGRYEIEQVIGRGGMGVVYRGYDSELNRPVAIKVLSSHLADHGTARQRFAREARASAAIVHDNVVPIYDIQTESDRPFLVMPYVNGISLQGYVEQQGQLETRNMLQVALQIASGLSAAHAQGLIHRDIKPANVLLENGLSRVQITDFGLARAADDAAMTSSGIIAGTPHYMSPEQARGETLDQRTDLYSLGCVMYFMATGRTLYRGESPYSVIAQIGTGRYRPVRDFNADVPAFVEDVIDKLLEVRPRDRFQNAAQLINHLEKSLAHLYQPANRKAPGRVWSSRKKKRIGLLAGFTVGLVTILVILASLTPMIAGWFRNPGSGNGNPSQGMIEQSTAHRPMSTLEDLEFNLDQVESQLNELESQMQWGTGELNHVGGPFPASPLAELIELQEQLKTEPELNGRDDGYDIFDSPALPFPGDQTDQAETNQ